MNKTELRLTVIDLLDDENGVNEAGYRGLEKLCIENGFTDILDAVEAQDGRFYLGEDDAAELRVV